MTAPCYLHGAPRPVEADFDTADATVTFAVGDQLFLSSGKVFPMATGSHTITTDFLGICAQRKAAGITGTALRIFGNSTDGKIRVDTDGEFEFDRGSGDTIALVVGDLMGPVSGQSQQIQKVGSETISIGRVVKNAAANSTRARIKINSAAVPAAKTT